MPELYGNSVMKKIAKKFRSFQEAEEWDILQQIRMTPSQRQVIAKKLRERFFGKNNPDVREYHRKK